MITGGHYRTSCPVARTFIYHRQEILGQKLLGFVVTDITNLEEILRNLNNICTTNVYQPTARTREFDIKLTGEIADAIFQ